MRRTVRYGGTYYICDCIYVCGVCGNVDMCVECVGIGYVGMWMRVCVCGNVDVCVGVYGYVFACVRIWIYVWGMWMCVCVCENVDVCVGVGGCVWG